MLTYLNVPTRTVDSVEGLGLKTHNELYSIWRDMKRRCRDPRRPEFKNYGGRGIFVCEPWCVFENFLTDMGPRPTKWHCLERINNDGPYSPENCKWATREEQNNNRRNTVVLLFRGEKKTRSQWAKELGLTVFGIRQRLRMGWSIEKTLSTPNTTPNKKKPNRIPEEKIQTILRSLEAGMSAAAIAREESVASQTVLNLKKRRGLGDAR